MQAQKQDYTDEARQGQMRAFVDQTVFRGGDIVALRADTSVRRFFRVVRDGKSSILMDARPPLEDTSVFETMQRKLSAIGLTVPDVYGVDHEHGLVLMEDFGDIRYFELITEKTGD